MDLEDRLKEFSYIFIRCLEEKLDYWQRYLEDRPGTLDTSKPGKILATAVSAIPQIGKGLSSAVKYGDNYVQNRSEKDTAQSMAEITYFSDNNKDAFRLILIEGAVDVFRRYEHQFSLVSCKGGVLRATQKLGSDAAHRIVSFLLRNRTVKNLTPEMVTKGIVLGNSPKNMKKIVADGRTVIVNNETVSTADFFANTGIRMENDGVITYYKNHNSLSLLRHRLRFPWEDRDVIVLTYEVDRPEYSYKCQLMERSKDDLVELVRRFIATKDPIEDVKEFIRVKDDELGSLIGASSVEFRELHDAAVVENREHHNLTRESIARVEGSIITYLNGMICETLKHNLEEDRKRREEYEMMKKEEDENRRKVEEEERRRKEEEERRSREEDERKRNEETRMLLERIEEQRTETKQDSIVIDGGAIAEQLRRVEDCYHREAPKIERETKRIVKQLKFKW